MSCSHRLSEEQRHRLSHGLEVRLILVKLPALKKIIFFPKGWRSTLGLPTHPHTSNQKNEAPFPGVQRPVHEGERSCTSIAEVLICLQLRFRYTSLSPLWFLIEYVGTLLQVYQAWTVGYSETW
jgi:hypothetical protein